jgi:hypothetical protein
VPYIVSFPDGDEAVAATSHALRDLVLDYLNRACVPAEATIHVQLSVNESDVLESRPPLDPTR